MQTEISHNNYIIIPLGTYEPVDLCVLYVTAKDTDFKLLVALGPPFRKDMLLICSFIQILVIKKFKDVGVTTKFKIMTRWLVEVSSCA